MKQFCLAIFTIALLTSTNAQKKNFWKGHNPSETVKTHKSVARNSFPKDFKLLMLTTAHSTWNCYQLQIKKPVKNQQS